MYRDSSIAPLLDLRHQLKVVHDVLVEMVRNGFSLARSLELAAQWDCVLRAGPMHPISAEDLMRVQDGCLEVVGGLHERLSDFIQSCCREEAVRGWRNWLREELLDRPYRWLRPDLVPPAPFCSVILALLLVGLGFWLTLRGLMRNSVKPGFPIFVVLGKGKPAWRNSMRRLKVGYLCCLRLMCRPCLVLIVLRL